MLGLHSHAPDPFSLLCFSLSVLVLLEGRECRFPVVPEIRNPASEVANRAAHKAAGEAEIHPAVQPMSLLSNCPPNPHPPTTKASKHLTFP